MYRLTSNFSNTKLVLVRRQITDGSCSTLIVMSAMPPKYQMRLYSQPIKHQTGMSPDCPTPPPPPKSRTFFYGAVGATLLTGAAVVYAKKSPDARNWLESNIPWANDFVALVYQENTTYWRFSINQFNKITTAMSHFMFGKEGVSPLDFQQRPEQDIEADAKKLFAKKDYESTLIQTDKCVPQETPVVNVTKDMVELEQVMHENIKVAIDNYKSATQNYADYNKALYRIVESSIGDLDSKNFSALQGAAIERDNHEKKAKAAAAKAKRAIDTLDRMIAAGVQVPPETVAITLRYIKQFRADLDKAEKQFKAEAERAVLADKYWNKVEAARSTYKKELQALFPGIDLSARKLDLKGDDTDLLLMYTLKQVQFLQNEIAELQTVRELQINRAIECHDEKEIIDAKIDTMIKSERIKRENEYQKKAIELQAAADRNLKEQLKKQLEIQLDVQQDRLKKLEAEILGKFSRRVSEELQEERNEFKKELAAMAGKMKAIEQTLIQRAKAEAEARRSQSLWAAAEALLSVTRRSSNEQASINNEIKALEKAGTGDKLVETVLKGIPSEVREKGVATEKLLRNKFETLEKTAVKVALVGREGASLPVYFMSWLQSKLLFHKLAEIPQDELNNLPTDFSKLDTFDIIQRAKYYMEHGDIPSTVRYVNLLQGGARAAAMPWLDEAKRHLEVKQAAEAVMAHASVSGLLYL